MLLFLACSARAQDALFIQSGGQLKVLPGAKLYAKGSITLRNGAQLINNGVVQVSNNIKSYWVDSTTNTGSVSGIGSVQFEGAGDIYFSGSARFYNVLINGTAVRLDSSASIRVSNQLTLKKGVIYTGSSPLFLTDNSPAALQNDSANPGYKQSYVAGTLYRAIGSNGGEYDFPIGDTSSSHIIRFLNHYIAGTTALTASFGPKSGTDAGLSVYEGAYYIAIHNAGVWNLKADAPATAGTYGLQVFVNGFSSLSDNQFAILLRPEKSTRGIDWMVPAGNTLPSGGSPGRTVSSGFAQRNQLNNFTNTQLGIGIASSALPVSFAAFTASRKNAGQVQLEWKTVSETNNKGFYIERREGSAGGFTDVGWAASRAYGGSSNQPLLYSFTDTNYYAGTSYYRLRQTDKDGGEKQSATVSVAGYPGISRAFPNPGKGLFTIILPATAQYGLIVSNTEGKIVMQQKVRGTSTIDLTALAGGLYTLWIVDEQKNTLLREKLILQK